MKALSSFLIGLLMTAASLARADRPATHGMLVFGEDAIYASHLPMFHSPHDYQVLVELALPSAAREVYLKDRAAHPEERVYTLVPERFDLPYVVQNRKAFKAALVRGHFERGGVEIVAETPVQIQRVLYFARLDGSTKALDTGSYLLFGRYGAAYAAHVINGRPNFDQILSVEVKNIKLAQMIEQRPSVGIRILRPTFPGPLPEGTPFIAEYPRDPETNDILVTLKQVYLETGDLQ